MKPVAFDYSRPASVQEACALLAEDEGARILAGGQTLIPMLAMRLARPTRLVDIARIEGLSGIRDNGDSVVIGATTRQAVAERDAVVASRVPLLAKALPWVGHAPTRARGTIGGSLANGDPAAEIALVAVTLGAILVIESLSGRSEIPAGELYLGPMITTISNAGVVSSVRFPAWPQGRVGTCFQEVSARRSDFAFASSAAQVALDADGKCLAIAVGVGGACDVPTRLEGLEEALVGRPLEEARVRDAVASATRRLETVGDLHASSAYRQRVAATLARRAILEAGDEAAGKRHAS